MRKVFAIVLIFTVISSQSLIVAQGVSDKDSPSSAASPQTQEPKGVVAASEQPVIQPEPQTPSAQTGSGNITVNFKGADIRTVLAYIAEVGGVDIIVDPKVTGTVDLKLTDKPWKVALAAIAKNYGLAYEISDYYVRVVPAGALGPQDLAMRTFILNYASAPDVATAIAGLLKNSVDDVKWVASSKIPAVDQRPLTKRDTSDASREVTEEQNLAYTLTSAAYISSNFKISYDIRSNSISVVGSEEYIERVAKLIQMYDTRTPQIMIEARVIETVLGDDEKLGIDWNVKISAKGAKRPTTVPFDFLGKGNAYLNQFLPLSQVATATATGAGAGSTAVLVPAADFPANSAGEKSFPFAIKDDFTFGTLDFTEFSAVLELLKERKDTDTVSNPRIATLNNNKATINVGETVYLPTFERNSTTGKMEITGYTTEDAGIVLNVVPRVNSRNEIEVDLLPQIIDYLGTSPIAPGSDVYAPSFRTRQARTKVMIQDGQTIFIGGLINERTVDRRKKLPFIGDLLGDVPYLGLLVSKKDIVKQRVELIFFITVKLMAPGKSISGSPLPDQANTPVFADTQLGNTANSKKRLKKESCAP